MEMHGQTQTDGRRTGGRVDGRPGGRSDGAGRNDGTYAELILRRVGAELRDAVQLPPHTLELAEREARGSDSGARTHARTHVRMNARSAETAGRAHLGTGLDWPAGRGPGCGCPS